MEDSTARLFAVRDLMSFSHACHSRPQPFRPLSLRTRITQRAGRIRQIVAAELSGAGERVTIDGLLFERHTCVLSIMRANQSSAHPVLCESMRKGVGDTPDSVIRATPH